MRARHFWSLATLGLAWFAAGGMRAGAQQTTQQKGKKPRAGQTIVIRGQVPTPQVVTVRPREVPEYSRQALSATNATGSFWSSALPGYQLLTHSQVTGRAPVDSVTGQSVAVGGAGAGLGAPAAAAGAAAAAPADLQARTKEMEAIRAELARRRARLDSLERADRAAAAQQQVKDSAGVAAARTQTNASDSAARAAEIAELLKELEFRRARLDSLEAVVRALGVARDSARATHDTTSHQHR